MIRVTQQGIEEALRKLVKLRSMLGPSMRVRLQLEERTVEILTRQAGLGRNVTNLRADEEREVAALARVHVEQARDEDGRIRGGDAANRKMYRELGELLREIVAGKIDDSRPASKRPLSAGYARWKARTFSFVHPILVATGRMLTDVRRAQVRVEKR